MKAHGTGLGESAVNSLVSGMLRGASEGVMMMAVELRTMDVSDKPWYVRTGGRSPRLEAARTTRSFTPTRTATRRAAKSMKYGVKMHHAGLHERESWR